MTIPMLASALANMVQVLGLDPALYSLHSLCRGGAMTAYHQGLPQELIKWHGFCASDAFWDYITSLCVSSSLVAAWLALAVQSTSSSPP